MTSKIKAYDVNGIQINVGDPVMCVGDAYGLTVGKTYTVESISESGEFVRVVGDNGLVDGWGGSNFRIDKSEIYLGASKFKAGDEVRVVGLENTREAYSIGHLMLRVGDEGVVSAVVGGACVIGYFYYHSDDLELVKDEPIKATDEFATGGMVKITSSAMAGSDISGLVGKVVGRRGRYWGVEFDHVTGDIAAGNPYLFLQREVEHFDPKSADETGGDPVVRASLVTFVDDKKCIFFRAQDGNWSLFRGRAEGAWMTGDLSVIERLKPETIAELMGE